MNKLCLSFLTLVGLPAFLNAQPGYGNGGRQESNVISIYSVGGEYFYVVINGVTQNMAPQSSLRIDGITQPTDDIQIMFADNRTPQVRKTITVSNPVDHRPVDLVMKLEREQNGEVKLRLDKCVPKESDYRPMQGEYVMFYGQDVRRDEHHRDHEQWGNGGGHQDVVVKETIVQQAPPPPPVPVGPVPMDDASFQSAKQSIANNSFDDTKLSTAKMITNTNYFTCDQVMQICGLFSFEDSKLNFAKYAYKKTVDNNNYFRVNDVFTFDASKQALNDFVSRGGH